MYTKNYKILNPLFCCGHNIGSKKGPKSLCHLEIGFCYGLSFTFDTVMTRRCDILLKMGCIRQNKPIYCQCDKFRNESLRHSSESQRSSIPTNSNDRVTCKRPASLSVRCRSDKVTV